jgi:hypothetical protein
MKPRDFADAIIESVKKSFRPKNLFLFLILSLIVFDSIRYVLVRFIYSPLVFVSPVYEEFIQQYGNILPEVFIQTLPIIFPLLLLVFMATVIRNVQEENLKENLIFSMKKLPKLVLLSLILVAVFAGINFSFNWLMISQIERMTLIEDISVELWGIEMAAEMVGIRSLTIDQLLLIFSLISMPSGIPAVLILLMIFLFFFLFQEALITDKSIFDSIKGSIKLFKENYFLIPSIWIVISLINLALISAMWVAFPEVSTALIPTPGVDINLVILVHLLVMGWLSLFQVVLITEVYLKIRDKSGL